MTTRRLFLAVILSSACSPRAAWSAEDEGTISRFTSLPARPLQAEDLEVAIAVPRLDDIEGDMVRRRLNLGERGDLAAFGFALNVMNDAFAETSGEDARWMLRRMASLTEPQILQALLATSMSASEVRLALEKLLSKRQKMVADFGLSSELPDIARRRIDRSLEFDPAKPDDLRAVTLSLPGGATIVPERGDWVIQKGHLVRRVVAPPPRVVEDVPWRRQDSSASWASSRRGSWSTPLSPSPACGPRPRCTTRPPIFRRATPI
jgi:hypothetical protein